MYPFLHTKYLAKDFLNTQSALFYGKIRSFLKCILFLNFSRKLSIVQDSPGMGDQGGRINSTRAGVDHVTSDHELFWYYAKCVSRYQPCSSVLVLCSIYIT